MAGGLTCAGHRSAGRSAYLFLLPPFASVCDDDPHSRSRALKLVRVARENFTQI
jgi:hypothetical protein